MGEKFLERCEVRGQEELSKGIFSLTLRAEKIAAKAVPGQFVSVYCEDRSRLLPRPISICETGRHYGEDGGRDWKLLQEGLLRLVYRASGEGTKSFSRLREGDRVDLTGPLGNGFPLQKAEGKRVLLVGGGIGTPPMLELSRALRETGKAREITAALGYQSETFLDREIGTYCRVLVATEDGSHGCPGNVLTAITREKIEADLIYACGPLPMLRALKAYALEHQIECWLSMEEKMACGIGACLSCVLKTEEIDAHSQVKNRRVCTEGPVFLSTEIVL